MTIGVVRPCLDKMNHLIFWKATVQMTSLAVCDTQTTVERGEPRVHSEAGSPTVVKYTIQRQTFRTSLPHLL